MTNNEELFYHLICKSTINGEIKWKIETDYPFAMTQTFYYFVTKFLGFEIEVHEREISLSKNEEKIVIFPTIELKEIENLYDFLWHELVETPQQNDLTKQFLEEYDKWKNIKFVNVFEDN